MAAFLRTVRGRSFVLDQLESVISPKLRGA